MEDGTNTLLSLSEWKFLYLFFFIFSLYLIWNIILIIVFYMYWELFPTPLAKLFIIHSISYIVASIRSCPQKDEYIFL